MGAKYRGIKNGSKIYRMGQNIERNGEYGKIQRGIKNGGKYSGMKNWYTYREQWRMEQWSHGNGEWRQTIERNGEWCNI